MAPSSAYVSAIVVIIAAPSTHAQTALGPASPAARHAPNSHPDPMIEPSPVSIRAMLPTSRRIGEGESTQISRAGEAIAATLDIHDPLDPFSRVLWHHGALRRYY